MQLGRERANLSSTYTGIYHYRFACLPACWLAWTYEVFIASLADIEAFNRHIRALDRLSLVLRNYACFIGLLLACLREESITTWALNLSISFNQSVKKKLRAQCRDFLFTDRFAVPSSSGITSTVGLDSDKED